jgi:hypothetical protein
VSSPRTWNASINRSTQSASYSHQMQTDVLQFFDLARGLLKIGRPSIAGQPTPYRELHELNRMRASLLRGGPAHISLLETSR